MADSEEQSSPKRRPDGTMMPGHTANRKGRPPKSRNMLTLFEEKANEKVALKVDGKVVKMSRLEAWVTNVWNKAMALDAKASATVLAILRASGKLEPKPSETTDLGEDDAAVLDALLGRLSSKKEGASDE
jgi:hypothetical protein